MQVWTLVQSEFKNMKVQRQLKNDQNPTIWCHLEEDGFSFESGSLQDFFLMLFFSNTGLLIKDLGLHVDSSKSGFLAMPIVICTNYTAFNCWNYWKFPLFCWFLVVIQSIVMDINDILSFTHIMGSYHGCPTGLWWSITVVLGCGLLIIQWT